MRLLPTGCNTRVAAGHLLAHQREGRNALAFENTLREAYIDLALADAPLSFRLGRQQVIWGESDQFRLMDIINPLDTTWHLQQEEWDKLRVPLWLVKIIWDMGDLGPITNAFTEVVWNPGDFQPGNKVEFLPAPWAIPMRQSDPLRPDPACPARTADSALAGVQPAGHEHSPGQFRRAIIADASDIGVRFHGVTDIPLVNMQGFEFTANYLYARGRGIGAVAGSPFGLEDREGRRPERSSSRPTPSARTPRTPPARRRRCSAGRPVYPADVDAEFGIHPYTHIFGTTANWFEGNYTNTVFRMEQAYQLDAPFQSASFMTRPQDSAGREHRVGPPTRPQPGVMRRSASPSATSGPA